jgi:threonine/homoserine/homoserine lactone efflux protein
MIGAPSQIPNEPGGLPQLPLVLSLLGAAFLVFFAGLAVLDSGRNLRSVRPTSAKRRSNGWR